VWQTGAVKSWQVGGALIRHGDGLVLVANRRRDQSVDWTPPGGVIDPGESLAEGLAREVREETGLIVQQMVRCAYRVEVEAPSMEWILRVEAWEVEVAGDPSSHAVVDDPDGIVEHCRSVPAVEARSLMVHSPMWIHVPVGAWLDGQCGRHPDPAAEFRFRLHGTDRGSTRVEQLS
jgi:8-oxo-dGTP diphosphatase